MDDTFYDGHDELYHHAKFGEDRTTRAGCRCENVVCFCARRLSVERYSYSDVAGWLGGWVAGWVAVTLRYCIKTAKAIGKLFRPSESPIILVF